MFSNPHSPPVRLFDVKQRNHEDKDVVNPLGGPDAGNGGGLRHQEDIDDVDDEDAKLQSHGCRSVARTRNSLEEGHGEGAQKRGGTNHIDRRDSRLRQCHIIGVDMKDYFRNDRNYGNQDYRAQETVFHHSPDGRHHLVALALADDATRQGVGRRCKGDARDDENHIGASHHRRNPDGRLPHLLNHDEENEPCTKREQPLYHARESHLENVAHQGRLPLMPTKHAIFLMRYLDIGINPEETECRELSHERGQSRTTNSHLGQANVTENQSPVEEDVDHSHDNRRIGDDPSAADTDIEGTKQEVEHNEHDAELPEFQILICCHIDILRLNDDMQQPMAKEKQYAEQKYA